MMSGTLTVDSDIKDVLCNYLKGFTKNYDCLVAHLAQPDIESTDLVKYIRSLRDSISLLNKDFDFLVSVILKIDWTTREDFVVKEYECFIVNLVSAHTYYLRTCLHMLVRHFYPEKKALPAEYLKENTSGVDETTRMYHDLAFSNVHLVIRHLCIIVPIATATLVTLLDDCFPYHTRCVFTQECYIQNLLTVSRYLGPERLPILTLIVGRMLQIDVRCPRNEIQETEDLEGEEVEHDVFDLEGEEGGDAVVGCMRHPEAHKLDVMMHVMFIYIHSVCHHKDGTLDWESTKKLYREMLCVYEKLLLPTYASCHVQFLLFYLCSLKEALHEGYLDFLWKYIQNPNTEVIHRQSAVSYIASLLARATYISVGTVKTMLQLMCVWLHKYIEGATHSTQPDVWRHGPFYSVCQAVFYILAFRHKEILATRKGNKWVSGLRLQTLITARLNPLKVCLPVVTRTFANIARMHQLAFCDAIIERNNRSVLPIACHNSTITHVNKLDSFFPFDPYLLLRSNAFVCEIYREFEGVVQEDTRDLEEEDEFLNELDETDLTSRITASTVDLMHYSISPGFKHI